MKKIVHVQVIPQLSGVQQVSFDILKGLDNHYDKYIIFGGEEKDSKVHDIFESKGITVIYIDSLKRNISLMDFNAAFDLYKIFRKYNFDIVHTNSTKPGVIGRIAAKIAKVPKIVHTVHGIAFHKYESNLKRFFYYSLELGSCLFGDVNISVNKFYLRFYPRFICKSVSIYNGVDFSQLKVNKISSGNCINVGFFARLDKQKDPITFIRIVNFLYNNKLVNKNVHFYLAGDGELKGECLHLIKELELCGLITYVGWISDKSEFFNDIDILCQPSLWEAFGLNLVEASYFGIPCVASNVEGVSEVIEHDKTGLLCPPQNIRSFSEAIAKLVNNSSYRLALGTEASVKVKKEFQLSMMVNQYKEIYLN